MDNTAMHFHVIEQAGLRQAEFGKLVKVSRVTVNNWVRGRGAVDRRHCDKVMRVLAAIQSALDAADFPLSKDLSKAERERQVVTTITTHLKARK